MSKQLHLYGALAFAFSFAASIAGAQDLALCGAPPALPTTSQSEESLKGQLQGKADFLSKMVGKAELAGQVEAARKQLYQGSDAFFAAQKDAYLAYMFCLIVMQDKAADLSRKLMALQTFKGPPQPESRVSNSAPVFMKLLSNETRALDGYQFVSPPALPVGLSNGVVLPGGGRTRLVFQAADVDQISEIGRLSLVIKRHDAGNLSNFAYTVDPTKMPGFGAAQPRRYNVRIMKAKVEVSYIDDKSASSAVKADNLLEGTTFPLLRLDRNAGLQETLDFALLAADPGLYEIRFAAHVTGSGKEYALQTEPLYIFAK